MFYKDNKKNNDNYKIMRQLNHINSLLTIDKVMDL